MDPYDKKDFQGKATLDNEVKAFHHDCIGLLRFRNKHNHSMMGTGFLIASDLVLTAAQNIYSQEEKGAHNNITFYPGISGKFEG
jgi:V8-like Glu-specific endopeptidase